MKNEVVSDAHGLKTINNNMYSDFLMNDNYDYISKWTRYLYWNLCILNETTGITTLNNE